MVDWTVEATAAAALRARGIESDLTDASLHAFAKAAVSEIAARGYGPQTGVLRYVTASGLGLITLSPPAASITSITEEGTTLVVDVDYRIRPGGHFLERLASGYLSAWNGRVVVTYNAAPADDRYDRVVVDLVKLALEYSGLDSRRDGDYAEEAAGARGGGLNSYQTQRDQIISELAPSWSFA